MVSHVEYATRTLLTLEKDGRKPDHFTPRLPLDVASGIMNIESEYSNMRIKTSHSYQMFVDKAPFARLQNWTAYTKYKRTK